MKKSRNAALCLECDTLIESKRRHDFVTCSCGAISVDGGQDYKRFLWKPGSRYQLMYDEEQDD